MMDHEKEIKRISELLAGLDARDLDIDGFKPSAVLVPIQFIDGKVSLLFTKRTGIVEHHKHQVSFPGGSLDDGENTLQCALRESQEEVGLEPGDVRILGRLDDIFTITSFTVTPYVGAIPYPYDFVSSEQEITEIFTVSVEHLLKPEIFRAEKYEAPWGDIPIYYYEAGQHTIWGATARILTQFLQLAYGKEIDT